MKHKNFLSAASLTLVLTSLLIVSACKKDKDDNPVAPPASWTTVGNDIYSLITGNVGIGISAPTDEMHIKKDVNSFVGITLENTDPGSSSTERLSFINEDGNLAFIQLNDDNSVSGPAMTMANNRPNGFITFNTGGTARATITNAGNLGVGTSAPGQRLQVAGNICATGTIGACSDIRYKKNIVPVTDVLNKILLLQGIYYNWNKKKIGADAYTPARQIGFSAQQIEQYFPEIVQTDSKGYKAVDYSRLTPMLVEAMKEQQQLIEQQRQQLEQQQAGMKELYAEITALKAFLKTQSE